MSLDRLSNMISMIKNASMADKTSVEILYTKECESVAKVLKENGFLSEVRTFKPEKSSYKMLRLEVSRDGDGNTSIKNAKRVSKPGRKIYRKSSELGLVESGFGVLVVSTSKGIMSGKEARKRKLGGEVICEVY
jgi:small subunit ribosomal protein S8